MPRYEKFVVVSGSDDFAMQEALRAAIDAMAPAEARDFNYDRLEGRSVDGQLLATLADTPPLMADCRLIHITEAEGLSKAALATLVDKVDEAAARKVADSGFLLAYSLGKVPPKDVRSRAGRHVDCRAPKPWEAERWVVQYARGTHGLELSSREAAIMVGTVGADTGVLAREVAKLALLADGPRMSGDLLERALAGSAGRTTYDLMDALVARDARAAHDILDNLLEQPAMSGVGIAVMLSYQLLDMARVRAAKDAGQSTKVEAGWPDWKAGKVLKQVGRWSLEETEAAMDALARADLDMKQGTPDRSALAQFLITAMAQRAVAQPSRLP
jgi:DNA polymerase III subunit delta